MQLLSGQLVAHKLTLETAISTRSEISQIELPTSSWCFTRLQMKKKKKYATISIPCHAFHPSVPLLAQLYQLVLQQAGKLFHGLVHLGVQQGEILHSAFAFVPHTARYLGQAGIVLHRYTARERGELGQIQLAGKRNVVVLDVEQHHRIVRGGSRITASCRR